MRHNIFFVLAACGAAAMGFPSCQDFLEEENKVGATADLSYSTASGINGLVGTCYSFARGWYGKEAALGLSEMGTDLFYAGYDNKQKGLCTYIISSASLGTGNTADNPCLDNYWELFYSAIDACNNALQFIPKCGAISDKEKDQLSAEIYFLRGFYYFHMVNIWGDIPYNGAPVNSQNLNPTRTSESVIYGNILADLDKSIELFEKADYKKKTDGRANYYAARGIKARVLLYAASWLNGQLGKQVEGNDAYSNMSGAQLYKAAADEAQAVIDAKDYADFYTNYADVWTMKNESYTTNKEAVFGVTYSEDITTTANCIPKRYRTDNGGSPLDYNSLITRTGYSRGGSAMLLMFVSLWNNGCNDLGGSGQKDSQVFWRVAAGKTTIKSKTTGEDVEVGAAYSPYGRGFCRYLPSLKLWQLLVANEATDQRPEATLLTHYDIASPDLAGNVANYPNLQDTAIFYCALDGDSEEGKAMQAWAKDRYRIQFMAGGDIPVYTSLDPATALPTQEPKLVSDVYGDGRYKDAQTNGMGKASGMCSYPGIKKFLDDVYDVNYPTWDISNRDAIVMRVSELYLIKAEAELATGGDATATINALRAVRAKEGMDNSVSDVDLDKILDERAIELCGEQMRWFDLKRTGKLVDYVKKFNAQASANIQDYHVLRPIPQDELDAITNLGKGFEQNPGY